MRDAFSKMFWGYLFTLVEIHLFVIDILAEPVGYYLIFSGITSLVKSYPIGKKASNIALALIVLSIPSVFIQQEAMNQPINAGVVSVWSMYGGVLTIIHLLLFFYSFQLMTEIASQTADDDLIKRTSTSFKTLMAILLFLEILRPLAMNISSEGLVAPIVITAIIGFITQITFLVLLRRFMKIEDGGFPPDSNEDNSSLDISS